MAGMIPSRKNLQQIEQEIDNLRDRHNRAVDSWLKARFEPYDVDAKLVVVPDYWTQSGESK